MGRPTWQLIRRFRKWQRTTGRDREHASSPWRQPCGITSAARLLCHAPPRRIGREKLNAAGLRDSCDRVIDGGPVVRSNKAKREYSWRPRISGFPSELVASSRFSTNRGRIHPSNAVVARIVHRSGSVGTHMLKMTGTIATNDIVTDSSGLRSRLADSVLEQMAQEVNTGGGRPQLIDHDWTRLAGWVYHAWTEKEQATVRLCAEIAVPETAEEKQEARRRFDDYVRQMQEVRTQPYLHEISRWSCDCTAAWDVWCVYLHKKAIASEVAPTLKRMLDEDGLLDVGSCGFVGEAWIAAERHLLAPHRFLRASCSLPNPPNRDFLRALILARDNRPDLKIRLAIDCDLAGITESLKPFLERVFWWGPPFRGNPNAQPYGVTVHGPTELDELSGLLRTEFWWYGKEERTFEIEELVDRRLVGVHDGRDVYACRFIHSIFDARTGRPRHLDGAVRLYFADDWTARTDTHIDKFGKNAVRVKLWRVDGDLPLETWYSLIHMFFRENYTVPEYFGIDLPRRGMGI